ncbi:MAG: sensor histidine kinase, partial [Limisphaerales bacterium]
EESGLPLALEDLAGNAGNLFRIKCDFASAGPPPALEHGVAAHLYYIAQEAVLNALKHGRASRVTLSLKQVSGRYEMAIHDNGSGFDPGRGYAQGMGVRIMQYRARTIGATLNLKSAPGDGTSITCVFYAPARELAPKTRQTVTAPS